MTRRDKIMAFFDGATIAIMVMIVLAAAVKVLFFL